MPKVIYENAVNNATEATELRHAMKQWAEKRGDMFPYHAKITEVENEQE